MNIAPIEGIFTPIDKKRCPEAINFRGEFYFLSLAFNAFVKFRSSNSSSTILATFAFEEIINVLGVI